MLSGVSSDLAINVTSQLKLVFMIEQAFNDLIKSLRKEEMDTTHSLYFNCKLNGKSSYSKLICLVQ